MIESINFQIRKVTKARGSFPTDEAAMKLLYLALIRDGKTLTGVGRGWEVWAAARITGSSDLIAAPHATAQRENMVTVRPGVRSVRDLSFPAGNGFSPPPAFLSPNCAVSGSGEVTM